MAKAQANGLTLEYEDMGDAHRPAVLLVMGLGGQMILWPDEFCEDLVARGWRVIRYDNRDVGLSEKLDHLGRPNLLWEGIKSKLGLKVNAPYTLDDMAADAVGLLDALDIDSAHLVGASMGGMIAQIVAATHPQRTRSLVSIMSTTGSGKLPQANPSLQLRLVRPPKNTSREGLIAHSMQTWRLIGSPGYPEEEDYLRRKVTRHFDRSFHPPGFVRQLAAVLASGSRRRLLKKVQAPTLVIHGRDDPLVPVAAAYDTAKHVPDAELEIIEGMGHDLPPQLLPRIAKRIDRHLQAAETKSD